MQIPAGKPTASVLAAAARLAMLLAALSTAGCAVGPDFKTPQTAAPEAWSGSAPNQSAEPAPLAQWWRQFNDPLLVDLVEQALADNLDLKTARARLRQARAARGVAVGGLLPHVTATGEYQRQQNAAAGGQGQKSAGFSPVQDLYMTGLDAVWELDLFGGQRRQVEAAGAGVAAAVENIRDAQVSAAAEVALDYVTLRGYQRQIAVAKDTLAAQQATAAIIRRQKDAGFASALDAASAEATALTTQALIPVLETSARQTIHALSLLLARPPADLVGRLSGDGPQPSAPASLPVGVPSDLLRRRADIREAEAQLHAATAQIGVAVADFFPSFSLTGNVGWSNNLLGLWWAAASRSFSFGPSISWPIFQGGAIQANVRLQEALKDQAYLAYQKTVLTAFQDVENALVALGQEQLRRRALTQAVAANRKAVDLSLVLYAAGQTDFLSVLTAQRALYVNEDALAQSERNVATCLIALYKALGGGWESLPPETGEAAPAAEQAAAPVSPVSPVSPDATFPLG
ncbi:MAG: efflux transporter outer membrane subunit [Desulfovibrionaceae bacterium]|nr:efflux transporter outer membrane subunit [Desulfovibrionaceae bacterium]MBF0513784.1 efflux transporter outer membrane subunit [Desulfovibrionaceae bacterium]